MTNALGPRGESQAAAFLRRQRLSIVTANFQTRWGEIDLIARDKDTWIFVEVKTRSRKSNPSGADSITTAKRRRLTHAALSYMKMKRLEGENLRFDVVLIEGETVEWIANAFDPVGAFTF